MLQYLRSCCIYNILIIGLAIAFFIIGYMTHTLHTSDNILVYILTFMIFLELSKLVIEMMTKPDAPIMLRYLVAGLAIGVGRELYIAFIEKDMKWTLIYLFVLGILLIYRKFAINMTKDGR